MQVSSGAEWALPSGNRRSYSVALDSNDGLEALGEKWEVLKPGEKLRWLQKRVDILVLQYLFEEDAIGKDMYEQRLAQVRAK